MRLGAPLFEDCSDPDRWLAALSSHGYTAAYCPLDNTATPETIRRFEKAAAKSQIVIAEVGAWKNTNSSNDDERRSSIDFCKKQLALADEIGARCCVNITGSRGEDWAGPDPRNLTDENFDRIVQTTRGIIDAVQPKRTYFALETMPNMYPHTTASYMKLVHAIDRDRFAVHLDPVNMVVTPEIYYRTGDLIIDFIDKLGPMIQSCHAKDVILHQPAIVHLDEIRPGLGGLDYAAYLKALTKLEPDMPLMLEHLGSEEEYDKAAEHIRAVAKQEGLAFQ